MENWQDKKILVAEDEHINFLLIDTILKGTKIDIVHAANGKKALEFRLQSYFDVILMDLKMPLMDGFEATAEIRKFDKDIIIIAQTAHAFKREECLLRGFNDYISKPFNQKGLKEILIKYLNP